jgi:polysaccharide biosynthesis protein PslJ
VARRAVKGIGVFCPGVTAVVQLREARLRVEAPVYVVAAVVAGGVAGAVSATSLRLAAAVVAGLVLIGLVAHRPVVLAVIALIGVFAFQRVGSTALVSGNKPGVSYSDALLAAATVMALPAVLGTKELRRLRLAGFGVAVYLVCLLPTLLLNSALRGYLEWVHRLVLLGGSLLVGAWIAREGKIRPALRWLTFVTCIVAIATMTNAVRHGWLNSAPFGMNKNFVGGLLAAVIVVVFIARDELALKTRSWAAAVCIIGGGVIASHSRGGALAASVGLFLAFLLQSRLHRVGTKVLAVLVAAGLTVFIYTSVHQQESTSQSEFNNSSIGVRVNVEKATRQIWHLSPIYGVGLKYFNTGKYGPFAQPADNVVDNELAESGVIGLVGFVVLQGAVLTAGFRRGRGEQLAAAGFGTVAGLLAHGMVDIYWGASAVTLPFIIMGMGLAREPSNQIHPSGAAAFSSGQERRLSTGTLSRENKVGAI